MPKFQIVSDYKPSGDQPEAIESLARGVELGLPEQTLLGVTGSGKTFTMANIIEQVQRPTLVLAHNKTLAAQLCSEFREFFPQQRGGILRLLLRLLPAGSLYRPQRIPTSKKIPTSTTRWISLRHSATSALFERRDVIIVASVSCIYSLGDPIDYAQHGHLAAHRPCSGIGMRCCRKLVDIQYERNDVEF